MGRRLGRLAQVLVRVSRVPLVVAALLAIGLVSPAAADEPVPTPAPSLSPPSQQQIDDAKAALDRLANQGKQGNGTRSGTLTQAAGTADDGSGASAMFSWIRISDDAWWTLGAGLLVLVVASESTRLTVRRAKHRKSA